jgi:uncharacterized membrane protein YgdD (TMEM256/DUF423 family)
LGFSAWRSARSALTACTKSFSRNGRLDTWETAVQYHLIHAVVLLVLARSAPSNYSRLSFWLFATGIVIFSGTLYLLALTNLRWLGGNHSAGRPGPPWRLDCASHPEGEVNCPQRN